MEDFKIFTLPTKTEEDDEPEETRRSTSKEIDDDDGYPPHKNRILFLLIVAIICVFSIVVIRIVTTFEDYEVVKSWERKDSAESKYKSFGGNLIKYSGDGIFYTDFDGTLIWNFTYDMTNPCIDTKGTYVIAYDKKGTEVDIFSTKGFEKQLTTTTPIVEARVAAQGTVALLLQENNTSYIQMYDKSGSLLVSGEIHPENRGFPISMAISSDATRLLLSVLNVNNGELNSELVFYDFTSAGKAEEDNIVASYTYIGLLLPKVEYLKNDKAVAFGDSKIIIFNNNLKATLVKEIPLENEMKSVFYNDDHFGFITEKVVENGELVNELSVYNLYGFKSISREITESFSDVSLMDNDEILLFGDNNIAIYNLQGFEKFHTNIDEKIFGVVPGVTSRRYYLIEETKTEEIGLK